MINRIVLFWILSLLCGTFGGVVAAPVEVQWLGHAAFKVTSVQGKQILIDPFITKNPKTPAKLKQYSNYANVDVILITHAHQDHVGDALELANKFNIPVYAPPGLNDTFVSLGVLSTELAPRFNKGGSVYPLGSEIKITMTHAEHSSEYKWKNPESGRVEIHEGGEPVGFIIRFENGFTLYHMGDTGLFGDMQFIANYYNPDVIFIPIGGHFVMDPVDAAYAINHYLKANAAIPMHYGTFPLLKGNVNDLKLAMKKSKTKIFEMVPGDVIKF